MDELIQQWLMPRDLARRAPASGAACPAATLRPLDNRLRVLRVYERLPRLHVDRLLRHHGLPDQRPSRPPGAVLLHGLAELPHVAGRAEERLECGHEVVLVNAEVVLEADGQDDPAQQQEDRDGLPPAVDGAQPQHEGHGERHEGLGRDLEAEEAEGRRAEDDLVQGDATAPTASQAAAQRRLEEGRRPLPGALHALHA
eukprot:CAMPEP_0179254886 /NCGR_PEP_ID=MMETSP0797-20121207/23465_1 /TAXON_ID=47934 /ORGANISM="Dinophysis acuminata, Strain DAEP01" /LENGTH=198 /DNA_ID=CAMNT_0020962769 /DNA_START=72 /DNA_END=669 /DNA_ORIENTATION=+